MDGRRDARRQREAQRCALRARERCAAERCAAELARRVGGVQQTSIVVGLGVRVVGELQEVRRCHAVAGAVSSVQSAFRSTDHF